MTVATATLLKVRQRFDRIPTDPGFQAAFGFILGLATSQPETGAAEDVAPRVNLSSEPSPLRLTVQMQSWVDAHADSLEYADLAKRAAADVIAFWTRERSKQGDLFGSAQTASHIWEGARNAGAFSDLCRVFFGKFTERYIKYFLDREASARLPSIEARERFAESLERHVDALARHSFETTKIAQSFAAGWYNKYARRSATRPRCGRRVSLVRDGQTPRGASAGVVGAVSPTIEVCCNGAGAEGHKKPLRLEYRQDSAKRNVRLGLPRLVKDLLHIPPRTLSEEGGFIQKTSSTGFVEEPQRKSRNRKEDPHGCSKGLQTHGLSREPRYNRMLWIG